MPTEHHQSPDWSPKCKARTVAGNHEKLIIFIDVMDLDIRKGGHYLMLRGKLGALLKFEIANRPR